MQKQSIDIQVALTTSHYMIDSKNNDPIGDIEFLDADVPILVAQLGVHIISKKHKEAVEFRVAQYSQKLAGMVKIDTNLRRVLIGKPPFTEKDILVDYVHEDDSECINRFFERWEHLNCLFFEYQAKNLKNNNVYCLRGYWREDQWHKLYIDHKPRFNIKFIPG